MSRIKIVPNADPNADGEWIELPFDLPSRSRWRHIDALVSQAVPAGYHVVAVECGSRNVTPAAQRVVQLTDRK